MIKSNRPPNLLMERVSSGVAVLVLNRAEVRNALDRDLIDSMAAALDLLMHEPIMPVLILTGGGDAFCAGADLHERKRLTPAERGKHTSAIAALADALASYPLPTVAAVDGFALAGGAELAVACDVRVAASTAVFGFPEVKIGIFPGAGGVLRLPKLVGPGMARDLLFTGRQVAADEALRIGLVDRLVPSETALPAAQEMAMQIAANAPLAVRSLKLALRESSGLPDADAARIIAHYRRQLDDTEDYAEGLAAFEERRLPRFLGR